jgi:hypothetical protein
MADESFRIVLVDPTTAATLAQILPVLLLTLAVELRRTGWIHDGRTRIVGVFLFAFGAVETTLLFSIDGAFYPFQWFDSIVGLIIFGLLALIFSMSLHVTRSDEPGEGQ